MNAPHWPEWTEKLKRSYLAGGSSMFILHGNVADVLGSAEGEKYAVEPLSDFLARRLFGSYDLVLHYDLGRGLRAYSGQDAARLTRMNTLVSRLVGDNVEMPKDPTQCLRTLDRLVSLLLVGEENRALKTAVLFDYADLICSADDRGGEHLATFLNWARSPVIRRVNLVFLLLTESLSRLHPILVQSSHTEEIFLSLPSQAERAEFVRAQFPAYGANADRLAAMSAGLTLSNLDRMICVFGQSRTSKEAESAPARGKVAQKEQGAPDAGIVKTEAASAPIEKAAFSDASDFAQLSEIKKGLMEAQCPGLIEFVEPKYSLDMAAGHTAAKERLKNDARLVREGRFDAVPMGYLLCGPVGVGKTFLAMCYAGAVGIPCVTIRNFRSKYVGETEANLERILSVVRELGPVAVIVDEADAALGNRGASGDSGTSARVFAQLASQMGNTEYRGKIIWFLLTCRPDLLPIDLKRQGRCEEHIPLFYPQTADEIREMFLAMGRKAGFDVDASALPEFKDVPPLSGADIEGVLMRARRESLLRNQPIDKPLIEEVLKNFRSARGLSHELQTLAAVMECSDLRYLPADLRRQVEKPGGFDAMTLRFRELEAMEDRGE